MTAPRAVGAPRLATAAVVLLALAGAWLRLAGLGASGLWLDEILGVGFVGPEHGPAYYLAIRLGHWLGGSEAAFRVPFALAGTATLPLVALTTARFAGPAAAVIATALAAFSPLHVYYSREARPYALLVLWGVVGLLAAVRLARGERRWSWHAVFAASLGLLLLTSSNGLFYGAALLVAYLMAVPAAATWRRGLARVGAALGFFLVGGAVFVALYGEMLEPAASGRWLPSPPRLASLFDALVSAHSEQGVAVAPWAAPLAAVLALTGAAAGGRRCGLAAAGVLAAAFVGFFAPAVALESRNHWINARYVLPALVPLVVLMAAGLGAGVHALARRGRDRLAVALALTVGFGIWGVQREALARGLTGRADWRHIATLIAERARPGDLVLTTNEWTAVCLGYYLPRAGASVRLENAHESVPVAQQLVDHAGLAWIVSGGHHTDEAIRRWAASRPLVWSHPVEAVRIWFHPDRATYVGNRLPATEAAGLAARFWSEAHGRLVLDDRAEPWLVDGWHAVERDGRGAPFRWIDGRRARVLVARGDRPPTGVAIVLQPFGPVQVDQRMTVRLNGVLVSSTALASGWQTQSFELPESAWRDGLSVIEIELAAAASPSSTGLGADSRVLGAAVRSIAIE